jgi:hypothetical protein
MQYSFIFDTFDLILACHNKSYNLKYFFTLMYTYVTFV